MKKKIFAIITAIAALVAVPCVVAACGGHEHSYTDTVIAPTCTKKGYTLHECDCGESYKDNEVSAKGHSYTQTQVAPTCTEKGYTLHECECGESYKDNEVSAKGHSYTQTQVAPTCTEKGYTLHECECGDSYKDNYVNANGHDYVNFVCGKCGDEGGDIPDTEGLVFVPRDRNSYSLAGIGTAQGEILKIPATYNGKPVVSISWQAFSGYEGFKKVFIPETIISLSSYTFYNFDSLENITVSSKNENYSSLNGVLYNKDKTKIIRVPTKRYGDFEILYGVNEIYYEAFKDCAGITSVNIPDSVKTIDGYAFA